MIKKEGFVSPSEEYGNRMDVAIAKIDRGIGELDYIQSCISSEIEMLQELHGEACERIHRLSFGMDLNNHSYKETDEETH